MYKRNQRTPRISEATPSRMTTSTPKSQAGNENDGGLKNLPSQPLRTASQKRKGTEERIDSRHSKLNKTNTFGSYFEEVVTQAGYIFQQGDNPHLLGT
jgi:hypothetical protein